MTESLTFSLYCLFAWAIVLAWKTSRARYAVLAGGLLGLLCLTRASFLVLLPVAAGLVVLNGWWLAGARRKSAWAHALVLVAAFAAVVGSWVARNAVSVGKPAISEEYGSVALIERFAYDDMTVREFVLAFPYCTPGIGDLAFDLVYGTESMHRFVYHTPDSFFHVGRGRRDLLVQQHGRLDPVIGDIVRTEMRENWWRYLLTSVPLGWCGMWVGGMLSLVLLPLFVVASVRAVRRAEPLLLLYAAPAVVMLGLHAAVANHYTRYNLILIGPFAVAAAWIMSSWRPFARWRAPARAPERSRSPSGRAA